MQKMHLSSNKKLLLDQEFVLLNLTENEFYFLREAFCGIEYAENASVAGA